MNKYHSIKLSQYST
ncbi:hypothetical protein F383_16687 [Gossypium arboreum]|uniref:Uncharacterized protein n=1 Tax=Gossypium arboreum TaxID=29729 RepID=A0A0B0NTD2_GOSAR|nr:hypothetical protein F383_16687 [Gossypium arboreum]